MNRLTRMTVSSAASVALSLTAAGSAWACHDPDPGDPGEWVPVETLIRDYYEPVEGQACGTTVTLSAGDVREVEVRQTTLADGSTVTEFRGDFTADVTRQDTGETIDELDISGYAKEVVSPDGTEVSFTLEGPSIGGPRNPIEEAAFEEAGLPTLAYWEEGEVTMHAVIDPATGEQVSVEIDNDAHWVEDVCTWFDDEDDCEDRHDSAAAKD